MKNPGNRKGHRTPSPQGLIKIKRIGLEAFLNLRKLLNKFKPRPKIKRTGIKQLMLKTFPERPNGLSENGTGLNPVSAYKPSNAINTCESLPWRWRRVYAWEQYINDTK
jgi:hypothetical protein